MRNGSPLFAKACAITRELFGFDRVGKVITHLPSGGLLIYLRARPDIDCGGKRNDLIEAKTIKTVGNHGVGGFRR